MYDKKKIFKFVSFRKDHVPFVELFSTIDTREKISNAVSNWATEYNGWHYEPPTVWFYCGLDLVLRCFFSLIAYP